MCNIFVSQALSNVVIQDYHIPVYAIQGAINESSEVIDSLLPATFSFNPSTRLDKAKKL